MTDPIKCPMCNHDISGFETIASLQREVAEVKRVATRNKWRVLPDGDNLEGETWQAYAADLDMQRMELQREVEKYKQMFEKDDLRTKEHNILVKENRDLLQQRDQTRAAVGMLRGAIEDILPQLDPDELGMLRKALTDTGGEGE